MVSSAIAVFAGLAVADDQLALARRSGSAHRCLETGRHRLIFRPARNNARRLDVDAASLAAVIGPLPSIRLPARIDHAAEQALPTGTSTMARALDGLPSLISQSLPVITMPTLSLSRLSAMPRRRSRTRPSRRPARCRAVDAGDAVADREHLAPSETSASWPEFAICSFRIAEISAARMSIKKLFHRV
jgi:hypothetical protein